MPRKSHSIALNRAFTLTEMKREDEIQVRPRRSGQAAALSPLTPCGQTAMFAIERFTIPEATMRRLLLAAVFAVLLSSTHAFAAAKYGAAGCGLGSIVFDSQPGIVQIFAATTNGTFGTQTFGITTGTSNCETAPGAAGAKVFIEGNREALAKDISRGQGETLKNLASLAGCADAGAVGSVLQKNFKAIFPAATTPSENVADSIVSTLKRETALACSKLG
jgi:hypothetical protein